MDYHVSPFALAVFGSLHGQLDFVLHADFCGALLAMDFFLVVLFWKNYLFSHQSLGNGSISPHVSKSYSFISKV